MGRGNVYSSTKLFSCCVPVPPQAPIFWGPQGEVPSGSHTMWDAELREQCRFWLLHLSRFLFLTLKKWPSKATLQFGWFGEGQAWVWGGGRLLGWREG